MDARPARLQWPTLCCICRAWGRSRICGPCESRFAPPAARCPRCASRTPEGVSVCANCQRQPPPFDRCIVVADYGFPWDAVIGRFKFHDGLDLADALAALLARAVAAAAAPAPALVLPVPLGPERLAQRGYNQSAELATRSARRLGLACDTTLLQRLVDTPHQAQLPLQARRSSLLGCFGVDPAHSHPLRGRTVAVVDDVVTSGATAGEAARSLRAAGAASVQVWAFARTPPPSDA
ncbi:ComF family protein [Aquincola sp. MAHUQ-54]|uniref:ComF family protein n=1 Tax=Aquincola agrisoli TaxID=3119538 RepID=A0AAW9QJK7_9BURK